MKKLLFGMFIALMVMSAAQAETNVLLSTKIEPGSDHKWIRPCILVKNTGNTNFNLFGGRYIDYYFYDSDPNLVNMLAYPEIWYCSKGSDGITFSFSKISEVNGPHGKKANYRCRVTFTTSKVIGVHEKMELKFGFHANDWRIFNENDDWSYRANTDYYTPTATLVLSGPMGNVFNGRTPEDLPTLLTAAKNKIQYVIFIMQENRSFDHYFGTFPGADNIPNGSVTGTVSGIPGFVASSFHNTSPIDPNEPHFGPYSDMCTNGGVDGEGNLLASSFLEAAYSYPYPPHDEDFTRSALGYHTDAEIPHLWQYAENFVLSDRMFAPCPSWSMPSHLYMVSAWSAICDGTNPCFSYIPPSDRGLQYDHFTWKTIVDLLENHSPPVDWRYYFMLNFNVDDCASCTGPCISPYTNDIYFSIWDPLKNFENIKGTPIEDKIKNGEPHEGIDEFMSDIDNVTLKPVTWVIPGIIGSDHAGGYAGRDINVTDGQTYVTTVINKIMSKPEIWEHCAIFLSWDDWGGFYDHVMPPKPDQNGYGIRVPAMLISPYAKQGYIDHQEFSHDAYLKFIEDLFLDGQRLWGDGRGMDPKASIRENQPNMGDLLYEFDFSQAPRDPMIICPVK